MHSRDERQQSVSTALATRARSCGCLCVVGRACTVVVCVHSLGRNPPTQRTPRAQRQWTDRRARHAHTTHCIAHGHATSSLFSQTNKRSKPAQRHVPLALRLSPLQGHGVPYGCSGEGGCCVSCSSPPCGPVKQNAQKATVTACEKAVCAGEQGSRCRCTRAAPGAFCCEEGP